MAYAGELARGKSKHRPRNDAKLFEDGKYPFIQTGDVKAQKTITEFNKKYSDFGLQQSKLWKKGTLCITIAANIAETGF
jgi:type I restriction enzyme S subunit